MCVCVCVREREREREREGENLFGGEGGLQVHNRHFFLSYLFSKSEKR